MSYSTKVSACICALVLVGCVQSQKNTLQVVKETPELRTPSSEYITRSFFFGFTEGGMVDFDAETISMDIALDAKSDPSFNLFYYGDNDLEFEVTAFLCDKNSLRALGGYFQHALNFARYCAEIKNGTYNFSAGLTDKVNLNMAFSHQDIQYSLRQNREIFESEDRSKVSLILRFKESSWMGKSSSLTYYLESRLYHGTTTFRNYFKPSLKRHLLDTPRG